MKTLVLTNQKGGVGKTAIAALVAHYLASLGHRVLCIDLDHQANLTFPLARSGKCVVSATTADKVLTDPEATVEDAPFVLMQSASTALLGLERQADQHTPFARNLRAFLKRMDGRFDFCIIDTNPNPDIRVMAALVSSDYVLSPIQLNQESIRGIQGLFNHERVGIATVKSKYNAKLQFLGMLPTMVEPTKFQKDNAARLMASTTYRRHLLTFAGGSDQAGFAIVPRRTVIAEVQASGEVLWEIKGKTAARDTWVEIKPVMHRIAQLMGAA
jgi:chromosome partitioning protein